MWLFYFREIINKCDIFSATTFLQPEIPSPWRNPGTSTSRLCWQSARRVKLRPQVLARVWWCARVCSPCRPPVCTHARRCSPQCPRFTTAESRTSAPRASRGSARACCCPDSTHSPVCFLFVHRPVCYSVLIILFISFNLIFCFV